MNNKLHDIIDPNEKPIDVKIDDSSPIPGLKKWIPNTLRYKSALANSLRELERMKDNYSKSPLLKEVELTEEQFSKYIPLYQIQSLELIEKDPNAVPYFRTLNEELIKIVGRNKHFYVIWNEPNGTKTKMRFSPRFVECDTISSDKAHILDIFKHLSTCGNFRHEHRADTDFVNSFAESQDFEYLSKVVHTYRKEIYELNNFLNKKKSVTSEIQEYSLSTNIPKKEETDVNPDEDLIWD